MSDESKVQRGPETPGVKRPKKRKWHPYKIEPIKMKEDPDAKKPIKGAEIIDERYPGSFGLIAKTKSGKTTVINHILHHTIDKRTTVFIFCSTVTIDEGWIAIVKWLRSEGIGVYTFEKMIEFDGRHKKNHLAALYDKFKEEDDNKRKKKKYKKGLHEIATKPTFLATPNLIQDPELVGVQPEPEYPDWAPERLVIMDDLDYEELKDPAVGNALKKTRHYHARVIISSQHIMHLSKSAFAQLSVILVWAGFSADYMQSLVEGRMTTDFGWKQFYLIYKKVTEEKHAFVAIYQNENEIRRNFDMPPIPMKYIFESEENKL